MKRINPRFREMHRAGVAAILQDDGWFPSIVARDSE
jgi:hypothetical protein